jgi:hypothetical protein
VALTTYSYTISTDFPAGGVVSSTLTTEIGASAIVTALERINTTGDSINIVFKDALSAGDKTLLDAGISNPAGGLIAAHDNTPLTDLAIPVVIQEESEATRTGGHYGAESINFEAPGPSGTITTHDVTLTIPISMLTASIDAKNKNDGDEIGLDVAPETIVGTLGTDASASSTTIDLPQSVMNLFMSGTLFIGQSLILDDGTSKDNCGMITSVDQAAKTIDVVTGTTNAFLAATPTYIKITTSMSPAVLTTGWVELASGDNKLYLFGDSKIGGSHIGEGKVIRVRYKNNNGTEAHVSVILEYLY